MQDWKEMFLIHLFEEMKGRSSSTSALQIYSTAATSTLTPFQMLLWSCWGIRSWECTPYLPSQSVSAVLWMKSWTFLHSGSILVNWNLTCLVYHLWTHQCTLRSQLPRCLTGCKGISPYQGQTLILCRCTWCSASLNLLAANPHWFRTGRFCLSTRTKLFHRMLFCLQLKLS